MRAQTIIRNFLSLALAGMLIEIAGCTPPPPPSGRGVFVFGKVSFDTTPAGTLPLGWIAGATDDGSPKWSVEPDSTAPTPPNVLKQSGEGVFPWCVAREVSLENGFIEVKFKPVSGKEDQTGGVMW